MRFDRTHGPDEREMMMVCTGHWQQGQDFSAIRALEEPLVGNVVVRLLALNSSTEGHLTIGLLRELNPQILARLAVAAFCNEGQRGLAGR